jgi:hypothetical protein
VRSPPDPSGRRVQMKHFVLVLVLVPVRMLAVARTIAAATVVASRSVRAMAPRRAHGGGQHIAAQRSAASGQAHEARKGRDPVGTYRKT